MYSGYAFMVQPLPKKKVRMIGTRKNEIIHVKLISENNTERSKCGVIISKMRC